MSVFLKAVLLELHKSVHWTGETGVAQSPGHNVIVMNELRLLFLLPGAYTPEKLCAWLHTISRHQGGGVIRLQKLWLFPQWI